LVNRLLILLSACLEKATVMLFIMMNLLPFRKLLFPGFLIVSLNFAVNLLLVEKRMFVVRRLFQKT